MRPCPHAHEPAAAALAFRSDCRSTGHASSATTCTTPCTLARLQPAIAQSRVGAACSRTIIPPCPMPYAVHSMISAAQPAPVTTEHISGDGPRCAGGMAHGPLEPLGEYQALRTQGHPSSSKPAQPPGRPTSRAHSPDSHVS